MLPRAARQLPSPSAFLSGGRTALVRSRLGHKPVTPECHEVGGSPRRSPRSAGARPKLAASATLWHPSRLTDARRGGKMGRGKRRRIEPTNDWELLLPLFSWPERNDEQLRPVPQFGASVA